MNMTVSTMHCCRSQLRALLVGLLLSFAASFAWPADISVRHPQLAIGDEGYVLAADFNLSLNPRLEDAVARGVALYFVVEFELSRSRWYWLDEQVAARTQSFQLSYHALTRQYRLSSGALHQSFPSLDDALRILSRLRNWQVAEKGGLRSDQTYFASLRMRLDLTQMPKTFQVNALANRDWNLSAEWARWQFTPADLPAVGASGATTIAPAGGDGR